MTELHQLIQAIQSEFPAARLKIDEGGSNARVSWLDIEHDGKGIVVEWRRGVGFGISVLPEAPAKPFEGLFQGPDEVFSDWVSAKDHLSLLLGETSSKRTRRIASA
jgi:hypothetical protein